MTSYVLAFCNSIVFLMWSSMALFLSYLIIYFFDSDASRAFLTLPEWSLLAFFIFRNSLEKHEKICKFQDFTNLRLSMSRNMFNFLSVVCITWFSISMILTRNYISPSPTQLDVVTYGNLTFFIASCVLFLSATFQEVKFSDGT